MTVDFSSDVGKVRALIPDIEKIPNPNRPYSDPEYMFSDEHVQALLDQNYGIARLAAADACEIIGTSEAIISKVIKTEDLQTDGAKLMHQFLARARQLRDRADLEEADPEGFDVVGYTATRGRWIG